MSRLVEPTGSSFGLGEAASLEGAAGGGVGGPNREAKSLLAERSRMISASFGTSRSTGGLGAGAGRGT